MQPFDFAIGTRVYCQDDECGKLIRVVTDPNTLQVKDLVVENGFLFKQAWVFPLAVVASASTEGILLSLRHDELVNFPPYFEEEYQPISDLDARWSTYQETLPEALILQMMTNYDPKTGMDVPIVQEKVYQDVMAHLAVLNQGTPIYGPDGEIGKLDYVITEADSDRVTHIVARHGVLIAEYFPIPVSLVQEVKRGGIQIAITQDGLKNLKQYIWSEDKLSSRKEWPHRQKEATDTPRHTHVLSHDLALRAIVANALSEDRQTEGAVIEVINDQGVVTLIGTVTDGKTRQAAERIAAEQPGVISIINALKVRQDDDVLGGNRSNQTGTEFHPLANPHLLK